MFFRLNEQTNAQINFGNIFNEGYIVSADANDNLTPGAPRSIVMSITSRF